MEKKQTAVEWIKMQIETPINDNKSLYEIIDDILNEAMKIELMQILEAYAMHPNSFNIRHRYGIKYYNRTYGYNLDEQMFYDNDLK